MMKTKMIIIMIVCILVMNLAFVFLHWYGKKEYEKINYIKRTGIETIGEITKKWKSFGKGTSLYNVRFDFEHNGKKIAVHQELHNETVYDKAIVGMKYKVKYLPDNPNKNGNSIIYIDESQYQPRDFKKEKKNLIYIMAGITLVIILFFWFIKKEDEKIEYIKQSGTETVGTITDKIRGCSEPLYEVYFEFEYNGDKIVSRQKIPKKTVYKNVIIGKQYKVKYLPDNPKNGNAVIFIDQPVEKE